MIIQGANNPIVVKFDADISTLPALLITLWHDSPCDNTPVKQWTLSDMTIDRDTAICPITAVIQTVRPGRFQMSPLRLMTR